MMEGILLSMRLQSLIYEITASCYSFQTVARWSYRRVVVAPKTEFFSYAGRVEMTRTDKFEYI